MELNLDYLLNKTSRKLHTIVRIIDIGKHVLSKSCLRMDLDDEALFSDLMKSTAINSYINKNDFTPLLLSINSVFVYSIVKMNKNYILVGPLKYSPSYSLKNSISAEIEVFSHIAEVLEFLKWETLLDSILDLANLYLHENNQLNITENDIVRYNCISENFEYNLRKDLEEKIFEQQETGGHHNPYDQEVRELSAIENGDIEALRRSISEDYTGTIGTLANDKLRSTKNVGIVVITNSSRAAIRGGLSSEIAFSMSDIYIKQVDEAPSENVSMQITRNAEFEFAKMVHEIKSEQITMNTFSGQENEHVMAAKNYIFKHLHGKITVAEIADALGLNANYLSGLFKAKEGISLKDYILNNKIILVKNLLTYSAYNYSEISYYLGFASQSHLGKVFREKTGFTLSQYRSKYQLQEFLD